MLGGALHAAAARSTTSRSPTGRWEMSREQLVFRARLTRFFLGATSLVVLHARVYPAARRYLWVYAAYLAFAAFEQILIRKRIGGTARSLVAGLVDLTVLTFTVHHLGSVATVMASLYFVAGVLNALVVGLRVGVVLAALNASAYAAVVGLEQMGALPYAPDVPELAAVGLPSLTHATVSVVLVTCLVIASTAIVGMLVNTLRSREDARSSTPTRSSSSSASATRSANLYNRRHLFERLEIEIERVRRGPLRSRSSTCSTSRPLPGGGQRRPGPPPRRPPAQGDRRRAHGHHPRDGRRREVRRRRVHGGAARYGRGAGEGRRAARRCERA